MASVQDKVDEIKAMSSYVDNTLEIFDVKKLSLKIKYLHRDNGFVKDAQIYLTLAPDEEETELMDKTVVSEETWAITQNAPDGKDIIMTTSRPLGTHTVFTTAGDDLQNNLIGEGTPWIFDFENSEHEVTDSITRPVPDGFKKKRIIAKFLDPVWLKEGTIYFDDAKKGTYVDLWVVCPVGQYYLKNDGTPALASVPTPVIHYVIHHRIYGNANMGDELNTEAAPTDPLPTNYELYIEVVTPNSDESTYALCELEIYRTRSVVLE